MVFRKLRNLVSRLAQTAVSKETAVTKPSTDDEQPEPTLVCSPCSSPKAVEVPVTSRKRKRQVSENEGDEVPVATATDKSCVRRRQNPKIQDNLDPFKVMMNYFDKRFEGMEKKLQQPSNRNAKIEDTFKFKRKGNRVQFKFNEQILQIVQNLTTDDLIAKLKRRNKLIKLADRSVLGWETVAKYETDAVASDSDDGKKFRQAENRTYSKRKSNELTVCVPSQRPSGQ